MLVLTIVMPSKEHTVYFDQPIKKPNYICLLSCSLHNWQLATGMKDKPTIMVTEPG